MGRRRWIAKRSERWTITCGEIGRTQCIGGRFGLQTDQPLGQRDLVVVVHVTVSGHFAAAFTKRPREMMMV